MNNSPFSDLPFELYQKIFEYLDLIEVFRLKFVSKKFNELIKLFEIKELIFDFNKFNYKYKLNDHNNHINTNELNNSNDNFNSNWFNSTRPINFKNMINLSKYPSFLKTTSFNLESLKYLRVSFLDITKSINRADLKLIEKFTNLLHLEIVINRLYDFSSKFSLPNLKVFLFISLMEAASIKSTIEMDLPKLESLYLNNFNLAKDIHFCNPLGIKFLKINKYYDEIELFKNLEQLELFNLTFYQSYYHPFKLNKDILTVLPKLKQLNVRSLPSLDFYYDQQANEYSESIDTIKYIMKQKLVLKRIDFKFYLRNILLINNDILINRFKITNSIDLILNNYELSSDRVDWVHSLDYNELLNQFNHSLPSSFFNKFNNLNEIRIQNKIKDENNFINFINYYPNLIKLELKDTELKFEFYENQLPKLCPQLFILEIYENEQFRLTNSNFLLKFKYLKEFTSNFLMSLESFLELYTFNYLEFVSIRNRNYTVSFDLMKGKKKFKIYCCSEIGYPKMSINFKEFVKSINYLDSKIDYLLSK